MGLGVEVTGAEVELCLLSPGEDLPGLSELQKEAERLRVRREAARNAKAQKAFENLQLRNARSTGSKVGLGPFESSRRELMWLRPDLYRQAEDTMDGASQSEVRICANCAR